MPGSLFGPDDRIGAGNYVTPTEVLRAIGLVREGRIIDLSLDIGVDSPRIPGINSPFVLSMWSHARPSQVVHRRRGTKNGVGFSDERIEFDTHTGTHMDALGHTCSGDVMYNGLPIDEVVGNRGLTDLDASRIPPLLTRGVVIDAPGLLGRDLRPGEPIGPDLLAAGEARIEGGIGRGDLVLVRTGWTRYYAVDNATYTGPAPGITLEAAVWLAERGVVAVGADTMSVEVTPSLDPENSDCVHAYLLVERGVYLVEQINLEEIVMLEATSFLCCCLAPRFAGATGSPLRLVAVL